MGGFNLDNETLLDRCLQDYIEFLWDSNSGLAVAQTTQAGIQLRHTVKLRGAWRLIGVWRKAEPPSRAPPLAVSCLLAMAMQAVLWGDVPLSASLLIGFSAYL